MVDENSDLHYAQPLVRTHLNGKCSRPFLLHAPIIIQNGTLVIKRVEIRPATVGNQYVSQVKVSNLSNHIRVGIQVHMLGCCHVYGNRGVIELLAPCTNGSRAVVRPS